MIAVKKLVKAMWLFVAVCIFLASKNFNNIVDLITKNCMNHSTLKHTTSLLWEITS